MDLAQNEKHEMIKQMKQLPGFEKKWGASVAVKITAPLLWAIIIVSMIVVVISQRDISEDVSDSLNKSADYIAYQLQKRLNRGDGNVTADDRVWLRKQLQEGSVSAVTLFDRDKVIVFGRSEPSHSETVREIFVSETGPSTKLHFKHPSIDQIVKIKRHEILLSVGASILLFALILTAIIHYKLTRPISDLIEATKHAAEGDLTKTIKVIRNDEFGQLGQFFNIMLDKLQDQQEKLEAAVKEAEDASFAKSTFLANMSHEIRTPLTAIIGFSEILRDGDLSEEERVKELSSIIRSGVHLQEIINDVLDLSKIEAGQLDIEQVETSPIEIIRDITSLFTYQAEEKGIGFNIKYKYPLPDKIITDPTRLKQIIANLCSNAIKFTDEGNVNLLVRYIDENNRLFVSVSDTGVGMSEEEQAHIFLPFTQADASITRRYGGTGLGLCISRELAEMLKGEIRCNSKKGVGSQFMLEIDAGDITGSKFVSSPVEVVADEKNGELSRNEKYFGKVLLAEDNQENRRLVGFYLKRAGVDFIAVEDGAKAVQYALEEDVDLVLMDMQMPIMDGVTAIRILRQQGFTRPIVMLTANVLAENKEACEQAGSNDFLSKPIDIKRFHSMLGQYLGKAT